MSDSGGILVACLAAPLLLIVLLVAGVSHLVLRAAQLTSMLAVEGLRFTGTALAKSIRIASDAARQSAATAVTAAGTVGQWAGTLFDSAASADRLRSIAHVNYQRRLQTLTATSSVRTIPNPSRIEPPAAARIGVSTDAHEHLARAEALESALQAEMPLRLVAEQWSAPELQAARASISEAHTSLLAGHIASADTAARRAESLLSVTAQRAHQRLAAAERTTVTAVIGNTMTDLGYEVRAAAAGGRAALVGRKADQTVALVVGSGGRIDMDMAGYEGDACDRDVKALIEALRKQGLTIAEACLARHGRPEGGALIRAARRRGKTLELALAEINAVPEVQGERTEVESAPVRRTTRLAADANSGEQAVAWVWQQQHASVGGRR